MLVSTVTAISLGAGFPSSFAASRTAFTPSAIIRGPPTACTFMMSAPSRVSTARLWATVLGMSWSFRSRNTFLFLSFR